uniref:glucagon-like peptide 1 receptor isoform X2 n=1 Tax=Myxine glutinosa TaxID=7769 RepID=UPI00358E1AB1
MLKASSMISSTSWTSCSGELERPSRQAHQHGIWWRVPNKSMTRSTAATCTCILNISAPTMILFLLYLFRQVNASLMKETYQNWKLYAEECHRNLSTHPYPETGVFCNRTFDLYACWPDTFAGNKATVPCPWYLPWIDSVAERTVHQVCATDGHWLRVGNSSLIWKDHSECEDTELWKQEEEAMLRTLQMIYTVGYSLSFCSLALSIFILLSLRRLHCTRNSIHINLFTSFMLRAASVLSKDVVLHSIFPSTSTEPDDWLVFLNNQVSCGCRASYVLMQYFVGVNYYWLLVEGLFLHNLLAARIPSRSTCFVYYAIVGWGTPVVFVAFWVIARINYENDGCWSTNQTTWIWWIIKGPIVFATMVNFSIFARIVQILLSKLKAQQMRFGDYKCRLARSTLTLIPLLGIHELIFVCLPEEHSTGVFRTVRHFFHLTLASFQGFFVSMLYCFANGEVRMEVKKSWYTWRQGWRPEWPFHASGYGASAQNSAAGPLGVTNT